MNFINKLSDSFAEGEDITSYLQDHIQDVHDFCLGQSYSQLLEHKSEIETFLLSNYQHINKLNVNESVNHTFIILLIEVCDRLDLLSFFRRLYSLLAKSSFEISSKLQAVALYSLDIRRIDDYFDIYDELIDKLSKAYEYEEDDIDNVVAILAQLYSKIVGDFAQFNSSGVKLFREKIKKTQSHLSFFKHSLIDEILEVDIADHDIGFRDVQSKIDFFLKRDKIVLIPDSTSFLIETDSIYSGQLKTTSKTFSGIRDLSVSHCSNTSDSVYYSLGRGVNILTELDQLPIYLKSYGNSHCAKMLSALNAIDFSQIGDSIEIVDWGCGQALASVVLLDYIKSKKIQISNVTLVEPSEIAIKRGVLHIKHMDSKIKIQTICKKLDSLTLNDFSSNRVTKINLFSNILDIDGYNQSQLIRLIKKSQRGLNYFVCVSPDVNEVKTSRLNSFSRFFENTYSESFNLLADYRNGGMLTDEYWCCNNKYKGDLGVYCHHTDTGCDKKWTRVVKVFNVDL